MLKSNLIYILVEKKEINQRQAELSVETIFESMTEAMELSNRLRGVGSGLGSI